MKKYLVSKELNKDSSAFFEITAVIIDSDDNETEEKSILRKHFKIEQSGYLIEK